MSKRRKRRKPRPHHHANRGMPLFSPTCDDPLHRLGALVGQAHVEQWMRDGAPHWMHALAMATLDDLPERLYPQAVELLIEKFPQLNQEACRAEPHGALLGFAVTAGVASGQWTEDDVRNMFDGS